MAAVQIPTRDTVDLLERGHNSNPGSEVLRLEVQEARAELAMMQAAAPPP